jgi:phosphoribosyl 1,2-cyclic phosphate phosphodiesterase
VINRQKDLEITFLGTGTSQGVPVIGCRCEVCKSIDPRDKRLRTSALISIGNTNILIDAGPDFRQQMLREEASSIDAILFTHEHKDHVGGLDDVRAFNFISKSAMEVYAEQRVQAALRKEYSYIFADKPYPGVPKLNLNTIELDSFEIKGIKITPIRIMHYHLPILGFRIGDLTYITDASYIPEEEKYKLHGSKYLVINALRAEKHISHLNIQEALQIINECAPRSAFLTHMSHQIGKHEDLLRILPDNVKPAYDGLKVKIL